MPSFDIKRFTGEVLGSAVLSTVVRDVMVRANIAAFSIPVPAGRWRAVATLVGEPARLSGPSAAAEAPDVTLGAPGTLDLGAVNLVAYRPHSAPSGSISARVVVYNHDGTAWRTWAQGMASASVAIAGAPSSTKQIGFSGLHLYSDFGGALRPWWQVGMDRAAELGATFLRLAWPWQILEEFGTPISTYHADMIDHFVGDAEARGLGLVVTMGGVPCWASSQPSKNCNTRAGRQAASAYPPSNFTNYQNFVKAVCDRWALEAVEPSNEPNHPTYGGFFTPANRVTLTASMRAGVQASTNPCPVLGAVLSESDAAYLGQLYDAGFAGTCDAICVHPYPLYTDGPQPFATRPSWAPEVYGREKYQMAEGLESLRDVAAARGEPNKRFWITEYGYNDSPKGGLYGHVSDSDRAAFYDWYIRQCARISYLDGFAIFSLTDPVNPEAKGFGWGICDYQWNKRQPTFDAIAAAITAVKAGMG